MTKTGNLQTLTQKALAVLLVMVLLITALPLVASATSQPITVTINGIRVDFDGQQAANVEGRILVPVRGVFEVLGFEATWQSHYPNTATLADGTDTIHLTIGSTTFTVNGTPYQLDVAPQLINGRTMIPLRAPLEALNRNIQLGWDGPTQTVTVTTQGGGTTVTPTPTPIPTPPTTNETRQQFIQRLVSEGTVNRIVRMTPEQLAQYNQNFRANFMNEFFHQRASSYILPNAAITHEERQAWVHDYWAHGGPISMELDFVRLLNERRAADYNRAALQMCYSLMMAARFYTQQASDIRAQGFSFPLGHRSGPDGGSGGVARLLGNFSVLGNGSSVIDSAQGVLDSWRTQSPGHHSQAMSTGHRFVGFGVFPGGFSYAMFASWPCNNPSCPTCSGLPAPATNIEPPVLEWTHPR